MVRGARRALLACLLLLTPATAAGQKYRYPFAAAHVSATYVTAHFDHAGKDYACGSKRYSGHKGNDYGVGSWTGMSAGRDIVAGAEGKVTYTHDGEYDQCSTGDCAGGGGYGNYVKLEHADGKVTYYAHMKKGTVAVKAGDAVTCGQKLGQAGSSGNSTGPHLHFEVRSGSAQQDPYKGSCGGYGYWVSQGDYLKLPATTCDGPSTPELGARLMSQGSDGHPGSGGAHYSLCPGQAFSFWFSLSNTGSLTWTDTGKSGTAGEAVRLGTQASPEPFGAPSRVSVNKASDAEVKPGETTRFSLQGTAPTFAGEQKSTWQLISEGVKWFGPAVYLTFAVTESPPGSGGDCDTGMAGVCGPGQMRCRGGEVRCVQLLQPSQEVCDGHDNDCDGQTDEGCQPKAHDGGVPADWQARLPPGVDLFRYGGGAEQRAQLLQGGCAAAGSDAGAPLAGVLLLALALLRARRRSDL